MRSGVPVGSFCSAARGGRLERVPAGDGFVSAFRASRERAPEARRNLENPMREHGENRTAEKKKRASERRRNFFRSRAFPFPCAVGFVPAVDPACARRRGKDFSYAEESLIVRSHFVYVFGFHEKS